MVVIQVSILPKCMILTGALQQTVEKHFICCIPGIVSNPCEIRPSPWQLAEGWRCGWSRETCGDRWPCSVQKSRLLQKFWLQTYLQLTCWQRCKFIRCKKMPKRSSGELWDFSTLELLDERSHGLRTKAGTQTSDLLPCPPLSLPSFSLMKWLSNTRLNLNSNKIT